MAFSNLNILTRYGHIIDSVAICGGLSSSRLYNQTISDVLNLKVIKPQEPESVLLGSAILAAASILDGGLEEALKNMQGPGVTYDPNQKDQEYHEKKYQVFLCMLEDQKKYRVMMN